MNMKQNYFTSLCTRALMLLLLVCSSAVALAQDYTKNDVNYYIDGTTAYVGQSGDATGDITILDKITVSGTNYPVTEIGSYAFSYNPNITSVTIPNSVQRIENHAFGGCDALVTVTIGSGVTYIGFDAFYNSTAVEDVYINANLEALDWYDEGSCDDFKSDGSTIGHVADAAAWNAKFGGIVNLTFVDPSTVPLTCSYNASTQTLTISGTQWMPNYSNTGNRPWNEYASEVKKVIIKDGVPNISEYALYGFKSLTDIVIPNSVQLIGEYAFCNCTSLTSISIPANVSSFSPLAFAYCTSLTAINIASSHPEYKTVNGNVYNKDGSMLFCCPAGKSTLTIGNSVTTIGDFACYYCEKLTSFSLPSSVELIGSSAFYGCTKLTAFEIPGVKCIESYAFGECKSLKEISIPDNVVSIKYDAFYYCTALTKASIGKGLSTIEVSTFEYCLSLENIYVNKDNPYMKSIDGVVYSKDGTTPIAYPSGRARAIIPEGVTIIPAYFFYPNRALTSVTLPSTLLTIEEYAFSECDALTSIFIPNSVQKIENHAFYQCDNLTSVTIGSGITYIGYDAFYDSGAITDVYLYADAATIEEWNEGGCDDFMPSKATICHVFNANTYQEKFGGIVRATFQSDLLPQVATESLTGSNLTTYYNGTENVKVPADVSVFKVALNGSKLTATEIEDRIINAGQGVILKANGDKTVAMATTTETSTADYSDNSLKGVDKYTTKPAGYKYYTLAETQGELAFLLIPGDKLMPHKAFIQVTSGPSNGYRFDDATGVEGMDNEPQTTDNSIYNLAGQRLNKMQKGINIVAGKKVLVK